MNTWRVIFATVVIFGAGVVTGGLLVKYSVVQNPPRQRTQSNRPIQTISAGGIRIEFLRRVERDLNLTADQREQVDKVLAASQERSKKIMEPVTPKIREELQQTREQFRAILNPEQKIRFDELLKQQQQQHQREQREQRHPPVRNSDTFSMPSSNAESYQKP